MSDFISFSDIVESKLSFNGVKEELFTIKTGIKSYMDAGLTSDEVPVAKMCQQAILSADNIVEKMFNTL